MTLAKTKAPIRLFLNNKKAEIENERGIKTLFFFNRSTASKLMAIDQALVRMKTINDITELELFLESLLCNKNLTRSRSPGILMSETEKELANLYNQYKLAKPRR